MIRVAPHFRASRSRYVCPDGQITTRPSKPLSSPLTKNISLLQKCKSGVGKAISCPQEGRIAVVTDVGCGMRWTLWAAADERGPRRTAKPCGPDTPTLVSSLAGGNPARRRRLTSPDSGESAEQPLKPLRRESRRCSGSPVVLPSCFFCTGPMGAIGTRLSLRPLSSRAEAWVQLGRDPRRGNTHLCHPLFEMLVGTVLAPSAHPRRPLGAFRRSSAVI